MPSRILRYLSMLIILSTLSTVAISNIGCNQGETKAKDLLRRAKESSNDFEKALDLVNEALEIDYTLSEAHAFRGYLFWERGVSAYDKYDDATARKYYSKAAKDYKNAIRFDPRNANYHITLANIYMDLGLYEEAAFSCRQALEVDPNNETAKSLLNHIEDSGLLDDKLR